MERVPAGPSNRQSWAEVYLLTLRRYRAKAARKGKKRKGKKRKVGR